MKAPFHHPCKKISANKKNKMAIQEFTEYLAVKGLGDYTIRVYLGYYKLFDAFVVEHGLNQTSVNQFLLAHTSSVTRAFLRNLFEMEDLTNIKIPKKTGRKAIKKRRSLTPQEIKVLRQWYYDHTDIRYLLLFDLSYFCALRRAEVMGIKVNDFEISEWAEDPLKSCKLLIRGKGKKERYVPVPPKTMHRIIDYIKDKDKEIDDRLFDFKFQVWHETFKKGIKANMDYNYTLHDLRRSRATQWINDNVDISRVKQRLGHASIQTTQTYINLDEKKEFDKWAEEY